MSTSTKTPISTSNTELFFKYLKNYKDEVKPKWTEGYYHVDVVAEAYNQGFSDGEKKGKKEFVDNLVSIEIENFTHKANQIYILSKNVISFLKDKGFTVAGLFIKLSYKCPCVIISVPNDTLNNDDFVELAYIKLHENKNIFSKLFNEVLDIGFVASDNLNEELLSNDGFGYSEIY